MFDQEQPINRLRGMLAEDGYLYENAAAIIASQAATAREHFPDSDALAAFLGIRDALEGRSTPVPEELIDRLTITGAAIREKDDIVVAALRSGVFAPGYQRLALRSLSKVGLSVLRDTAMGLTHYDDQFKPLGTLGERVRRLSSQA
jgi:hypothetical protein